jgi:hypothetical protein
VKRYLWCADRAVSRESFADTEFREDDIQQILNIHAARNPTETICAPSKIFRPYIKAGRNGGDRCRQRL